MEEKERYEYFFGTNTIKDNKTNQFYGCVVDLLNQQDKRIKELEEENKECKHWENMFHKLSTEEDNAITKVNKSLSNPMSLIDDYDKWADYTIEQIKQSQNQLAIKILKELRDKICKIGYDEDYNTDYFGVVKEIDDKIKSLKGEKNE